MHVVVIHGWQQETPEVVSGLAAALGIIPFEARQRMIGGGPAVVGGFADQVEAQGQIDRLRQAGFKTILIDSARLHDDARFLVRRFVARENMLEVEAGDGARCEIPYSAVRLLLVGIGTVMSSEVHTLTERKFSIGKTLLSGGIPMTSKVTRKEEVTSEERRKYLYLYIAGSPLFIFPQHLLNYDGLGAAMQPSQEPNFALLLSELRQRSSKALYDERLLNRLHLSRLLGVVRNPDNDLDLAAAIVAQAVLQDG